MLARKLRATAQAPAALRANPKRRQVAALHTQATRGTCTAFHYFSIAPGEICGQPFSTVAHDIAINGRLGGASGLHRPDCPSQSQSVLQQTIRGKGKARDTVPMMSRLPFLLAKCGILLSPQPGGFKELAPGRARNERLPGVNQHKTDCAPGGGAKVSRAASVGCGGPVVALVPRLMVAPATTLRARCRESCRSAPVTTG